MAGAGLVCCRGQSGWKGRAGDRCGAGIGAAIAGTFAGAGVCVAGRRSAPQAQTVQHVSEEGAAALALCADVAGLAAMTGAVEQVLDRFGRLGIVVATAGIQARPGAGLFA